MNTIALSPRTPCAGATRAVSNQRRTASCAREPTRRSARRSARPAPTGARPGTPKLRRTASVRSCSASSTIASKRTHPAASRRRSRARSGSEHPEELVFPTVSDFMTRTVRLAAESTPAAARPATRHHAPRGPAQPPESVVRLGYGGDQRQLDEARPIGRVVDPLHRLAIFLGLRPEDARHERLRLRS